MKRAFPYVTTGRVLDILKAEGCGITRVTFYKLEKKGVWEPFKKTSGNWRIFDYDHTVATIGAVKEEYGLSPEIVNVDMLPPKIINN